jgi:hypothetical protein
MKSTTVFRLLPIAAVTSVLWACGGSNHNSSNPATPPASGASTTAAAGPTLLVSRGVYDLSNNVTGTLPINNLESSSTATSATVTAVTPGTFPNVFTNDANDPNFGITADAVIDQWAPGATAPTTYLDVTAAAKAQGVNFTTSFSSKSEMALNVSQDGTAITFNGYDAPIDTIDASNSNTPGVIDPTNSDIATPTYRTVAQLNLSGKSLTFTNTNAYSGNNGRASVLVGGQYYIVGNAGNSGSQDTTNATTTAASANPTYGILDMLTANTGVQTITPGSNCPFSSPIGVFNTGSATGYGATTYTAAAAGTACPAASTTNGTIANGAITGFAIPAIMGTFVDPQANTTFSKKKFAGGNQFGFTLASVSGQAFDKTGKDDNFRGLYLAPDGTLYVSKGSGGNGVNAVFQVGSTGELANGGKLQSTDTITIPNGMLPTGWTGAPAATNLGATTGWQLSYGAGYPFGMWIPKSNPNIMFVADEGDGVSTASASGGSGGLWVYQRASATAPWAPIAQLTAGLNLGTNYNVTDPAGVSSYTTTPDGLRNITGQVNADGSFTIYAVTSTIGSTAANAAGVTTASTTFDEGCDSNQLVKITVNVSGSTVTPTGSGFSLMETAPFGQVLRGVALINN